MKYSIFLFIISIIMCFYSCKKETVLLQENFNTDSGRWDTLKTIYVSSQIKDGNLIMENKLSEVVNFNLYSSPVPSPDISVSSNIKAWQFHNEEGLFGLVLFADDQKFPKDYIFFGANKKGEILISKENKNPELAQTFYRQINSSLYRDNQINRFSVVSNENSIQFLLNEKPIMNIDKPKETGQFFGFITRGSSIKIDDLLIKSSM